MNAKQAKRVLAKMTDKAIGIIAQYPEVGGTKASIVRNVADRLEVYAALSENMSREKREPLRMEHAERIVEAVLALSSEPITIANPRLIAAAPDLYEAAKHAAMEWRLHGQLTDSCRVLEAAIAKAEGAK